MGVKKHLAERIMQEIRTSRSIEQMEEVMMSFPEE